MDTTTTTSLELHHKLLLAGNLLTITGIAIVSAGSLLSVLREGRLRDSPVYTNNVGKQYESTNHNLYSAKKSYFET